MEDQALFFLFLAVADRAFQNPAVPDALFRRDGVEEQQAPRFCAAADCLLRHVGLGAFLRQVMRALKDIAGAFRARHMDAVLPQPAKGRGDIQHILRGGGNQRHRDTGQRRQIRAKLLPHDIADAPHAAGHGKRDPQQPAGRQGAGGGKRAAHAALQRLLQRITVKPAVFAAAQAKGQVFLQCSGFQLSPVHPCQPRFRKGPCALQGRFVNGAKPMGQQAGLRQEFHQFQASSSLTLSTLARVRGR